MDGQVAAIDVGFADGIPLHPSCLPSGTLITPGNRVTGATSRVYDGELITFSTLSGELVSITPNHPVLTDRGWVAAGLLTEGSYVVRARLQQGVRVADDHYDDMPVTIEQIAKTFLGSLEVTAREVPTSSEDFHGDGAGSEVCVVGTYSRLPMESETACGEQLSEHGLQWADVTPRALVSDSASAPCLPGGVTPTDSGMRSSGPRSATLGGSAPLTDDGLLMLCTQNNAVFAQAAGQDTPGGAYAVGDWFDAFPGEISFDKIIYVRQDHFTGHVYNLQTETGFYIANSIIVHNCRCMYSVWDGP
jgi:hypothetical protein